MIIYNHPRVIIRKRLRELLEPKVDVGGRWFISRPQPKHMEELPCGLIYWTEEAADNEDTSPASYRREVATVTEVLQAMNPENEDTMEDYMDSRALEIEETIFTAGDFGLDFVEDVELIRTQATTVRFDGSMDIASTRLFWNIVYRTIPTGSGKLNEFLRFNADYKTRTMEQAEDTVIIRQE